MVNPIPPTGCPSEPAPDHPLPEPAPGPAGGARYVLFDFDGPLVRLFAEHPAPDVARRLLGELDRHLPGAGLAFTDRSDPHLLVLELPRLLAGLPSPRGVEAEQLVGRLSQVLAAEECRAAGTAVSTPGAGRLVAALRRAGCRLAVTSNNAPEAIHAYLDREQASGVAAAFREHVYGRSPDPRLMKPDPDCVRRALKGLRCEDPRRAVLIGDSPSDYEAATAAGVRFLGFAPTERAAHRLRAAEVPASMTVGHFADLPRVLALLTASLQRSNGPGCRS